MTPEQEKQIFGKHFNEFKRDMTLETRCIVCGYAHTYQYTETGDFYCEEHLRDMVSANEFDVLNEYLSGDSNVNY